MPKRTGITIKAHEFGPDYIGDLIEAPKGNGWTVVTGYREVPTVYPDRVVSELRVFTGTGDTQVYNLEDSIQLMIPM